MPPMSPERLIYLARHIRGLKSESERTRRLCDQAAEALTQAATERSPLTILETLMRDLKTQFADLLTDVKATRQEKADLKAALDTANTALVNASNQATTDAATIADLQKQLAAAGTPVSPGDQLSADDPLRIEADALIDADEAASQPPPPQGDGQPATPPADAAPPEAAPQQVIPEQPGIQHTV